MMRLRLKPAAMNALDRPAVAFMQSTIVFI
jgi:hypothetical protein